MKNIQRKKPMINLPEGLIHPKESSVGLEKNQQKNAQDPSEFFDNALIGNLGEKSSCKCNSKVLIVDENEFN